MALDQPGLLARVLYQSTNYEMVEVISCAKRKTLRLLKSLYENVFTVPDYELKIH